MIKVNWRTTFLLVLIVYSAVPSENNVNVLNNVNLLNKSNLQKLLLYTIG